jgi:hypothetical protein
MTDNGNVTKVTNATEVFTQSFNGIDEFKSTTGLLISGTLTAATTITVGGVEIPATTFTAKTFYPISVEKVVAGAADTVYVFER